MKRRPITLLAATLVVAALVVATGTAPARASGIVTAEYQLTSTSDIPVPSANATAPQVVAEVVPPGTVVPPTEADGTAGSPLTILNTSSGFDQSQLIVALKNGTDSSGQTQQLFGLSFFGNGFSKNGQLDFSLNLGSSVTTPPVLQSLTPGVSIAALPTESVHELRAGVWHAGPRWGHGARADVGGAVVDGGRPGPLPGPCPAAPRPRGSLSRTAPGHWSQRPARARSIDRNRARLTCNEGPSRRLRLDPARAAFRPSVAAPSAPLHRATPLAAGGRADIMVFCGGRQPGPPPRPRRRDPERTGLGLDRNPPHAPPRPETA